jgi:hypothetical protein
VERSPSLPTQSGLRRQAIGDETRAAVSRRARRAAQLMCAKTTRAWTCPRGLDAYGCTAVVCNSNGFIREAPGGGGGGGMA